MPIFFKQQIAGPQLKVPQLWTQNSSQTKI